MLLAVLNYFFSFIGLLSVIGAIFAGPLVVIFLIFALFEKDPKKQNGYLKKAGLAIVVPFASVVATLIGFAFVNTAFHAG